MFFALRDLRRTWRRFTLVGLVVGLVAVLSTVLAGLADGLVRDGTSGLRALPVTHLAFAPHSQSVFSRSTLDAQALAKWTQVPGVEATPIGVSFVNASSTDGGPSIDLALFGVRTDGFLGKHSRARPLPAELSGLVLASELREEGVRAGQRYRVRGSESAQPVLGFTFAGSYGHVPIAYTSLTSWQEITYGADARGHYSAIALRIPDGVDIAAADRAAGTETVTKSEAYDGSPGFSAEQATMTLIRGFLLVISALVVGAFFTVLTVQRRSQIGLLKALGASSGYVVRDGLGQIAIVVVAASAGGALVGAGIIALLEGGAVPAELSLTSVLGSVGLLVLTGILGSLVVLRRITKVEPAVALAVEA